MAKTCGQNKQHSSRPEEDRRPRTDKDVPADASVTEGQRALSHKEAVVPGAPVWTDDNKEPHASRPYHHQGPDTAHHHPCALPRNRRKGKKPHVD